VQLIKNKLLKVLEDRLLVGEDEISAYYRTHVADFNEKKIHLAQIFLEKEADGDMILKFLKSGTPFEELAKKYSLSPEGKNGGDLGWVSADGNAHMEPLFNAPVGVVLRVFKSPQGYHLYKIIGFKKVTSQPLADVKDRVIRAIKEKKLADAYLLWLEEQVKTVRVETNEGVIQSLNPSYQETL
jgi:peptidyl-prolyl cis-trans isomerase C